MKAIAAPGYGPLEQLTEIEAPLPAPARGEVRVRVVAAALNPADYKVVLGTLKFLHARNRPLIVGYDFSGTVEAIGPSVTRVSVGDDVFGFLPYGPGNRRGAFAESLIAKCDEIAVKPARVSHEIAAAAATTGVSGGVGSIAVGIAKKLNARVTAVGSGAGLALARRLGAVEALDRTQGPLPGAIRERFDVVFDASAAYRWRDWRGTLKPGGAFVTTLPSLAFVADKLRSLFAATRVHFVNVKSRPADLELLGSWLAAGLDVPLASTIPVRDVAKGLLRLQRSGGRIAVQVAGGF
jgi:NADPH:quinone reductase-like Zn-dependent oxidoreductase